MGNNERGLFWLETPLKPSRQVFDSQHGATVEQIDKHKHIEHAANTQKSELSEHKEVGNTKHKHDDDSERGDTGSTCYVPDMSVP